MNTISYCLRYFWFVSFQTLQGWTLRENFIMKYLSRMLIPTNNRSRRSRILGDSRQTLILITDPFFRPNSFFVEFIASSFATALVLAWTHWMIFLQTGGLRTFLTDLPSPIIETTFSFVLNYENLAYCLQLNCIYELLTIRLCFQIDRSLSYYLPYFGFSQYLYWIVPVW